MTTTDNQDPSHGIASHVMINVATGKKALASCGDELLFWDEETQCFRDDQGRRYTLLGSASCSL
jgi:hypothetical protein